MEIISTGYNGASRGWENCCDVGYCLREREGIPHGEANTIISASRRDMIGATLYLAKQESDSRSLKAVKHPLYKVLYRYYFALKSVCCEACQPLSCSRCGRPIYSIYFIYFPQKLLIQPAFIEPGISENFILHRLIDFPAIAANVPVIIALFSVVFVGKVIISSAF